MRAVHRQAEVLHHEVDARLPDLREDDELDVRNREPMACGELAHEARPALVVDLRRVALEHLHLRAARRDALGRRRLERAASVDAPETRDTRHRPGTPRRCTPARARLQDRRACAVAVEEPHRVVRLRQLVHQIHADDQHVPDRRIRHHDAGRRRDARGKRGARTAHVEGARVDGTELVLQDDGGGRREVVGRIGAQDDEIDPIGRETGAIDGLPGRRQRDVRRGRLLGRVEAGADAGRRLHLVDEFGQRRIESRAQVVVAHLDLRHVPAGRR